MTDFSPAWQFPTMPPREERAIWCEWLRRHSIDPNDVLVPGWIQRRPDAYQIAYLSAEFTEHGCMRWDPERREPVYTVRIAQLEGPPLPFPVIARQPDEGDAHDDDAAQGQDVGHAHHSSR